MTRYLVTGHTGFKGAWLVQLLAAAGHQVSGLALEPVSGALFTRARVADLLTHDLRVDIRDAAATAAAVAQVAPDVVIHLAAQPLVRESYRDPRTTWETNVLGTYNVLDAVAQEGGVQALLVITTDKVYRNLNRVAGYREDEPLGGVDPYSASKAAADLLTQSWIASAGCPTPTAIARAGNVVGGGDVCAERLMVDLVSAFDAGHDVHLRYPKAVRPWQHVLDCLAGYLALVEALLAGEQAGEAFNFGPGPDSFVEVGQVAETVAGLWGTDAGVVIDAAPELHEAGLLALDASKAKQALGWQDRLTFTDAMAWTVDWSKRVAAGEDPRAVCAEQVASFESILTGS
ncbi:MAG: CDP-glucose 4,6-dehydratase [Propionicimonas sp.]|uniref:CDP-glucose 4,6-dehydratase n=1 Tax=Propionicimonas sp. TaxID=1955623 RepID=UPI001D592276|nr:CDP-glucose 4,6-dehydratase [Propionicimonas sp.]MBU4186802.1 CDP-glucose 4,6-dehydratase [Actinomycetota bacterium]MBU4206264.1 CDP-glucose 4,6-dehydratase [Actinomycetota bacterium]MBU4251243.1 CDP-glucose 4,6-dehydratase [Actinomycetota bacterium]MBU4363328.1 CDP-glucose 4,6-dehydratase [Actinomycetota bacterium]MBU4409363.1 CDP-glucose 4,6-dehydratase [Actinomycetota bacterium]